MKRANNSLMFYRARACRVKRPRVAAILAREENSGWLRNLEIQITPDKELHGLNGRIGIERKGDVDMQDVAECGAVVEDAQANTHIAQPTRIHRVLRWAAPRPAHIIKYCPANAEQSNGIPIGIDTFFNCEQRPVVAALVAQGIAAQAVFAPEQQDILHVGIS